MTWLGTKRGMTAEGEAFYLHAHPHAHRRNSYTLESIEHKHPHRHHAKRPHRHVWKA